MEVEPGVFISTCETAPGVRELRRVRFSQKRFTETAAQKWWEEHRRRVLEQFNISNPPPVSRITTGHSKDGVAAAAAAGAHAGAATPRAGLQQQVRVTAR
jgi:hypothetical protein